MEIEPPLDERVVHVLRHLGITRAHVAASVASDWQVPRHQPVGSGLSDLRRFVLEPIQPARHPHRLEEPSSNFVMTLSLSGSAGAFLQIA
jgi:hypothetical protein